MVHHTSPKTSCSSRVAFPLICIMKPFLFVVCVLAVAVVAVQGNERDEALEWLEEDARDTLEKMQDEPETPDVADAPAIEHDAKSNKSIVDEHGCNCYDECNNLHYTNLPHDVRDPHKYLSYENFPILCRDAAALLLPEGGKPQKRYVCRQVFDCCRFCNLFFYKCLKFNPHNSYGFCIRGAYKCICKCVETRGHGELPAPY